MRRLHAGRFDLFHLTACLLLALGFTGSVARGELYEPFDTVTPTNLPAGWSQIVVDGVDSWVSTNVAGAKSSPNVVRLVSAEAETNAVWLVSPAVTVGTNFVAQFYLRNASANGMASVSLLASTNGSVSNTTDFTITVTNGIAVSTNWTAFSLHVSTSVVATGTVYFAVTGEAADGALLDLDNILLARGLVLGQVEGFESGLGEGWFSTVVTKPSGDPKLPVWEGTNTWQGQSAVFYNAKDLIFASTYSARLSQLNHLHAGGSMNMVISFDMYHYPEQGRWPVYLYPEYSLDDGQTWNNDGSVFLRDTDDYLPGWRTHRVVVKDAAFADASSIRVGLRASHQRSTGADLHVSNIRVDFLTLVGISEPWTEPLSPVYLDQMYVFADVEKLPTSDVTDLAVELFYRIAPTGTFSQVAMTNITNDVWRSADQLPSYEAGVKIEYYLRATYGSELGRNTASPQRMPVDSNLYASVTYGGLGSVWINEVFYNTDASNQFIEIAGPAERAAIQGWSLDVVDLAEGSNVLASYSISTNFANEANGYGFYLLGGSGVSNYEAELTNALPSQGGLRLVNSNGIVEHAVAYGYTNIYAGYTNIGSSSTNKSLSAVGYAAYVTNLWEGYSAAFSWTNAVPSPSSVTNGQGFLLEPMKATIYGLIYDAQSNPTNGIPFALVDVSLLLQGGSQILSSTVIANSNGCFSCVFSNLVNDATSGIPSTVSAQGFGYAAGSKTHSINTTPEGTMKQLDLGLTPSSAADGFSGPGLAAYWGSERIITRTGVNPDWYWDDEIGPDGESGVAVYNASVTPIPTTYAARLRHGNPLNSQNMQVLTVEYWMKHTPLGSWDCTLTLQYSTNTLSGSLWHNLGEPVDRNNGDWAGLWRRHRFSLDSEYFVTNQLVHVGLRADNNRLSPDMLIDDLRVTFGVDVLLSELAHAPLAPRFDEALDLRFGLSPVGVGVSNVMVDVVWSNSVSGGGWQTNAVTNVRYRVAGSSDAWSITNLSLAVLSTNLDVELVGAIPAQPAVSELSYFVQVEFKGPGADSIGDGGIKYLPDNATYAAGLTTLHGPYLPVPIEVAVAGVPSVWVNEVFYQTDPTNQFVELAGAATVDLTGWTLSVMDLANPLSTTNYALGTLGLTNNVFEGIGFLVLGGSAVTNADVLLGAALPADGGIRLYDASTNVIGAVSYGGEAAFGYEYAGVAGADESLAAWGQGNPSQARFAWTNQAVRTPGDQNPGQDLLNAGPAPSPFAFEDKASWSFGVTSIYARAVSGLSMFAPAEYRLWIEGGGDGGWGTDRGHTFSNLLENTAYSFLAQARDAVGVSNIVSGAVTSYTLLDTPGAPELVTRTTNSLSVSGTVTNLGVGDTALQFSRSGSVSGWEADGAYTFTGLDANTAYSVSVRGRNGDGVETGESPTNTFYTAANTPSVAPMPDRVGNHIVLTLTNAYDVGNDEPVDGNPIGTEYAIGTYGEDGITNYLVASGAVTNVPVWQVLPDWHAPEVPLQTQISIGGTNGFFLVARNGDGVVTEPGPIAEITFRLEVSTVGVVHLGDGIGHVEAVAEISNPLTNTCMVGLHYSISGSGGTWHPATLLEPVVTAYGSIPVLTNGFYQVQNVDTSNDGTNTLTVTWDARGDLEDGHFTNVWLRWDGFDPDAEMTSVSYFERGTLDLEYPVPVVSSTAASLTGLNPMPFSVDFGEAVTNFVAGDITVTNGDVTNFVDATGGVFTFGVVPVADGMVTVSVAAAKCQDLAGNTNKASNVEMREYDGTAPVALLSSTAPALGNSSPIPFSVDFGEVVTNFVAAGITVTNGDVTNFVDATNGVYTFGVVPLADGTVTVAVAAAVCRDLAGNDNEASGLVTREYDGTAPMPAIVSSAPDPTNGSPIPFSVDFGEVVTGFAAEDMTVGNGGVTNFVDATGGVYTFGVVPLADGTVTVAVASGVCEDLAGNGNQASSMITREYDGTAPVAVLSSTAEDPTNSNLLPFSLDFGEDVLTFAAVDISVANGVVTNFTDVTGGAYTFGVVPVADGTVTVAVAAAVCQDPAGNDNVASVVVTREYDGTAPVAALSSTYPALGNSSPLPFSVDFGEPVTGFVVGDIMVGNGSVTNFTDETGGVFSFAVVPAADGQIMVSVPATVCRDLAGNDNGGSSVLSRGYDGTAPGLATLMVSSSPAKRTEEVSLTFSATDANAITSVVATVNGRAAAFVSESGGNYMYAYTIVADDGDGWADIVVDVADAAGNRTTVTNATLLVTDQTPSIVIGGLDDMPIAENAGASLVAGTDFGYRNALVAATNHFVVTNNWREAVTITNWVLSGAGGAAFDVVVEPGPLAPGGSAGILSVVFEPGVAGDFEALLTLEHNGPDSTFRIPLAGSAFLVTPSVGPFAGGNAVMITNGYFGAITNVFVDGIDVADLIDSDVNWVNVVMPAATNSGSVNFVIQTSDRGDIVLPAAYTYNPAGAISSVTPASGSWTGLYEVVISGTDLCDGVDITNATLAGVSVASIESQSATQIVAIVGVANAAALGDVRVFSVSFGETVASNAFEYLREAQAPLVFQPQSPQVYLTAQPLSASGGNGTGAISYEVLSGPGLMAGTNMLLVTSGMGTIEVRATRAADSLYYAESMVRIVEAAKGTPTVTLEVTSPSPIYDGEPHSATVAIVSSSVSGSLANVLTGGAAAQTAVGMYPVTADFVPDESDNYSTLIGHPAGTFEIRPIPEHILQAGAVGAGTIVPAGAVSVQVHSNQLFTFTPDPWYGVADVVVDGISLGTLPSYNWENVQAPGTITVWFAENLITNNTPVPVPEAWMAQYGLTNDMASLVNVYHPEFGATTWQIYVMDANPTSGVGVLRLNLEQSNVTQRIGWYVSSNRVYSLFGSTNLNAGITNLLYGPFQPPQSGVWGYDDSDDAGRGFYRVRVELP